MQFSGDGHCQLNQPVKSGEDRDGGARLAEIHPGLLLDTIYKEVESRTHSLLVGKITLEVNQLHPSPSLLGAGAYAAYQELSHPEHLLTAFADRTALYARARELA